MSYNDVRLVVTIKNNQPIELLELTRSLVALANNFNRYASTHGKSIEDRGAKLYVKEIRSGSIEIELVELVSVAVLPFAENVNTILDFANYLFHAVNFYRSASGNKVQEYSESEPFEDPVRDYQDTEGGRLKIQPSYYTSKYC